MSYILDALRRSQAERERGQVPGLDARPGAVAAVPSGPPGQRWRWVAVAMLAGAALGLTLLWWALGTPPAVPARPTQLANPDAPAPVTATSPVAAPPAAAPTTPPAAPPAALPIVVSAPMPPPASQALPAAPAAVKARPASAAAATVVPAPSASAPSRTLLAALTPAQRRELPPLALGGSIWSDSALGRFVIVNGQVVREGEVAAPGVVVERIEPKAVVLRWRDLRLELPL